MAMREIEKALAELGDRDLATSVLETEIGSMKAIVELVRDQAPEVFPNTATPDPYTTRELAALRTIAEEVERLLSQHRGG